MWNDDTNKNLWNHSAAPAPETSALSRDISCDTAIIGGGFTGLSAALHLAEAGIDAVVLEARAIGFGGSGRNVGLVNAGMWMRPDDIIAAVGETTGERLVWELGDGPAYVFELIGKHGIDGVAFRLPDDARRDELNKMVHREILFKENLAMMRWIHVQTEAGKVRALVFWAGPKQGDRISLKLPLERVAFVLARACGYAGSCAEYLYNTVSHLEELGIRDRNLWRLQQLVAEEIVEAYGTPAKSD